MFVRFLYRNSSVVEAAVAAAAVNSTQNCYSISASESKGLSNDVGKWKITIVMLISLWLRDFSLVANLSFLGIIKKSFCLSYSNFHGGKSSVAEDQSRTRRGRTTTRNCLLSPKGKKKEWKEGHAANKITSFLSIFHNYPINLLLFAGRFGVSVHFAHEGNFMYGPESFLCVTNLSTNVEHHHHHQQQEGERERGSHEGQMKTCL